MARYFNKEIENKESWDKLLKNLSLMQGEEWVYSELTDTKNAQLYSSLLNILTHLTPEIVKYMELSTAKMEMINDRGAYEPPRSLPIMNHKPIVCYRCVEGSGFYIGGCHETCGNCGYHGDFTEYGDDCTCPNCSWGYAT